MCSVGGWDYVDFVEVESLLLSGVCGWNVLFCGAFSRDGHRDVTNDLCVFGEVQIWGTYHLFPRATVPYIFI